MRALPKMTMVDSMPCSLLHQLGLEQLELHAHRAQLLAQQELGVGEGEPVGALGPVVARRRRLRLRRLPARVGKLRAVSSLALVLVHGGSLRSARARAVLARRMHARTPGSAAGARRGSRSIPSCGASSICSRPGERRADAGEQLQRLGRLHRCRRCRPAARTRPSSRSATPRTPRRAGTGRRSTARRRRACRRPRSGRRSGSPRRRPAACGAATQAALTAWRVAKLSLQSSTTSAVGDQRVEQRGVGALDAAHARRTSGLIARDRLRAPTRPSAGRRAPGRARSGAAGW